MTITKVPLVEVRYYRGSIAFHRVGACLKKNRYSDVITREKAFRQGFRPCKKCKP